MAPAQQKSASEFASAMARLSRIRQSNTISFASNFKLYSTSLMTPPSSSMGVETWTLPADSEKKDPEFQNQVHEKTSSYLEHKTNDPMQSEITFLVGPQEPLLATVKRWKFAWFGHVTHHDSLSKTILQGKLEGG